MVERLRAWAVGLVLLLLVCAIGGAVASFLIPDFSADISRALLTRPPVQSGASGGSWCEDCESVGVAEPFLAGGRLALLGLLVIGIPLGICAKALTASNRRAAFDRQSGSVFQMGFVFQLGSVLLATAVLLFVVLDGLEGYRKAPMFALMLIGDVVIGAIALPSWRSLQERDPALVLHH